MSVSGTLPPQPNFSTPILVPHNPDGVELALFMG